MVINIATQDGQNEVLDFLPDHGPCSLSCLAPWALTHAVGGTGRGLEARIALDATALARVEQHAAAVAVAALAAERTLRVAAHPLRAGLAAVVRAQRALVVVCAAVAGRASRLG